MARLGGGEIMFCERCAPVTRGLTYDDAARPGAELLSSSCIWPDEKGRGWCSRCIGGARRLFHARYCMTVGEPVHPEYQALWDRTEREYPTWPLFRPERRSPEIADEVRRLVEDLNERLLGPEEAILAEEEESPPNLAPQRTRPAALLIRMIRAVFD